MKVKFSNLVLWLGLILILFNFGFDMNRSVGATEPQVIRAIIEQAKTAWIDRDADALAQLFTVDGELIVPGQRWQGRTRIRTEVAKYAQQYRDVSITISQIIIEGDRAAVEWHYEDTEHATGKRNKADDAIAIDFKAGQIDRWREYFDTQSRSLSQHQ